MSNNLRFSATFLTIYDESNAKFDLIGVLSLIKRLNSSEFTNMVHKNPNLMTCAIIGNQQLRFGRINVLNLLNMISGSDCGHETQKGRF